MKMKSLSSVRLFTTPWTVAYQAPLSMGFSRQYGLPFPSPVDPTQGLNPGLPHCRQTLYRLSHHSILKSRNFLIKDLLIKDLLIKVHLVKAMAFPVVMYECESWTIKKAEHRRIDAFELWCWGRLVSPLECKEIQLVYCKGNQSWIFIGKTDVEAEVPILWPPDVKNWLTRKDPDVGRDWRWEEKGTTEDEMAGWHHRLNGLEFEWTLGVDDELGGLGCCYSWGRKESDTTEWPNWTELNWI